MKLRLLLPPLAFSLLAASVLLAQQSAAPERFRIAGVFQLPVLTQDEFKQLSSQAEAGDREAQYWLALLYSGDGKFVPRDSTKFLDWLNKSAEQGYAPAQQIKEGVAMNDRVNSEMYLLRGRARKCRLAVLAGRRVRTELVWNDRHKRSSKVVPQSRRTGSTRCSSQPWDVV